MTEDKKEKQDDILNEIGFCPNLGTILQNGKIIGICKGRYERPKKFDKLKI